jgi:hypothetical protein
MTPVPHRSPPPRRLRAARARTRNALSSMLRLARVPCDRSGALARRPDAVRR